MSEVVVVGAGPAGLSAAAAARRGGATVRLLDSSEYTGGQYWRHLPASRPAQNEQVLHHGWSTYNKLRQTLEQDPGVRIETQTQVWAIDQTNDGRLRLNFTSGVVDGQSQRQESITPDQLVLATGAHDRTLPIPGWTLPGVFTAGAAQAMAKGERLRIGNQVVVAGAGPFLLPVTASLMQSGARVAGVYEASTTGRLAAGWLTRPWELLGATHKMGEVARYAWNQLRGRVPYRPGWGVTNIHGTDRVEAVTVSRLNDDWSAIAGTEKTVACDAVCLGHGFIPRLELAIAARCDLTPDRFVVVDDHQRTTVPGVFAAGEITTIGGVDLALAEGEIAGWVAAGGKAGDPSLARARRRRTQFTQFAKRISEAHPVGQAWPTWLTDATTVCRCEEVDFGTLKNVAQSTQSVGLRSLKLTTRAGLGLCQGRVCGRSVEQLLSDTGPGALIPGATTDRRPIVSPLRLGDLAATYEQEPAEADQVNPPSSTN